MSLIFLYKIFSIYFNLNKYISKNTVSQIEHIANVKDTIRISGTFTKFYIY